MGVSVIIRKKKRKNKITLYLDINVDGSREWENTGLSLNGNKVTDKMIMGQVNLVRAQKLIDISSGKYSVGRKSFNINFLQYYKRVIDERPEYERRAAVYKHLEKYCKLNFTDLTFKDINENFWSKFKVYLQGVNYKQSTIHLTLRLIKAVLNRAVREKIILQNPLQYIKEKKPKSLRMFLEWSELEKLYGTACSFLGLRNAFFLSCYTGLRLSDVEELRKLNFKIAGKIIIPKMEKTDEPLLIDINENLSEFLPDLSKLKDEDLIYQLPSRSTISVAIRQWAAAAGITKNVTYHTSRHTFATGILTYGGSVEAAQALLGHRDIRETQIYAKLIDQKKKDAINNLPKLKRII